MKRKIFHLSRKNDTNTGIYNHYEGFLLPIMLGNIYGSLNMHWEEDFFKYIIDQKVENISDVNWDFVIKQQPFLTRQQISLKLVDARSRGEVQGPLYKQIADFIISRIPTGRSSPKWIEERKLQVNHNQIKAKLNKTLSV